MMLKYKLKRRPGRVILGLIMEELRPPESERITEPCRTHLQKGVLF